MTINMRVNERFTLADFVRESNRIEGILRNPTPEEIDATARFVALDFFNVDDVRQLVHVYQPGHRLRDQSGLDVRIGSYYPPAGGPMVGTLLRSLLDDINARRLSPYVGHCRYESLHPFTDGNGRSGRALWLWAMGGIERAPLGFLHTFYYQALDALDR